MSSHTAGPAVLIASHMHAAPTHIKAELILTDPCNHRRLPVTIKCLTLELRDKPQSINEALMTNTCCRFEVFPLTVFTTLCPVRRPCWCLVHREFQSGDTHHIRLSAHCFGDGFLILMNVSPAGGAFLWKAEEEIIHPSIIC